MASGHRPYRRQPSLGMRLLNRAAFVVAPQKTKIHVEHQRREITSRVRHAYRRVQSAPQPSNRNDIEMNYFRNMSAFHQRPTQMDDQSLEASINTNFLQAFRTPGPNQSRSDIMNWNDALTTPMSSGPRVPVDSRRPSMRAFSPVMRKKKTHAREPELRRSLSAPQVANLEDTLSPMSPPHRPFHSPYPTRRIGADVPSSMSQSRLLSPSATVAQTPSFTSIHSRMYTPHYVPSAAPSPLVLDQSLGRRTRRRPPPLFFQNDRAFWHREDTTEDRANQSLRSNRSVTPTEATLPLLSADVTPAPLAYWPYFFREGSIPRATLENYDTSTLQSEPRSATSMRANRWRLESMGTYQPMLEEHEEEEALIIEEIDDESFMMYYNCNPPPIVIPLMTIAEIVIFVYYLVELKSDSHPGNDVTWSSGCPLYSPLIWHPARRIEAWRYLSYSLIHNGYFHLGFNCLLQLVLGMLLEWVHKGWRVGIVYLMGVLAGSLAHSMFDPHAYLVGASGGCYALLGAHFATAVMNWKEMQNGWLDSFPQFMSSAAVSLFFIFLLCGGDTSVAVYNRFTNPDPEKRVGFAAHGGGFTAGILVGILILLNFKVKHWEVQLQRVCLVIFLLFVVAALIFNILCGPFKLCEPARSGLLGWTNHSRPCNWTLSSNSSQKDIICI